MQQPAADAERAGPHAAGLRLRLEALLQRHWWRPDTTMLSRALAPLSILYGALFRLERALARPRASPVPVLVVGNLVAGGAGKTPTVIALVEALRAAGHRPGVVARGHGGAGATAREVSVDDTADLVGDEPLLIRRRTGAPVWVGRQRADAAAALCAHHPEVDCLLSDDGLQHHALARDAELLLFDRRGIGNGRLLPAGPLREPMPTALLARQRVLYTDDRPSTPLHGALATRRLGRGWPLADWHRGDASHAVPLSALHGRSIVAAAGIATPSAFFAMLRAEGVAIVPMALADHWPYTTLPWPPGTPEVICTEKDAVKLAPHRVGATRVWVVPLDLQLPEAFVPGLLPLLGLRAA